MARWTHLRAALGEAQFERVQKANVLMVGAGGIGCELLKNLVLMGFEGKVEVVDLDTIDLSNLNRQFLFQRQHISKSKAVTARESALRFNPNANIVAHHASIMDPKFGVEYFAQFQLVLNALDNIPARRHVNRLCLAANVPVIESGTAGYLGQVSVIVKGRTECFECQPIAPPKTFPVCTIRSTPSAPIHCIVWAKDYLFPQLFGAGVADEENEPSGAGTDNNECRGGRARGRAGAPAEELKALHQEANALRQLIEHKGAPDFGKRVFTKVFTTDVMRLVSMSDMWKNRAAPTPLDYDTIMAAPAATAAGPASGGSGGGGGGGGGGGEKLKDQQLLSLRETAEVFEQSLLKLAERAEANLVFDKDDDDVMDFVAATANLRAHVYGIDRQTRFAAKSMAGNIIPAIATTNAIAAGLIVLQALHVLANELDQCASIYLTYGGRRDRVFSQQKLAPPRPACFVCQHTQVTLKIDPETATIKFLAETVLRGQLSMREPAITDSTTSPPRLLYDIEFTDNEAATMASLGLVHGTLLQLEDSSQDLKLQMRIVASTEFADRNALFELVGADQAAATESARAQASRKRKAEADDASGPASAASGASTTVDDDDDVVMVVSGDGGGSSGTDLDAPSGKRARTS